MAAIEVVLKPITNPKTIHSIKKALSVSSVDKKAIEKARKDLEEKFGFNEKVKN